MEFTITDEQSAFRKSVLNFSKKEIEPMMEEYEKKSEFCRPAWNKLAEFGIMGLPFPEEYGGAGAGVLTTCLGMEALAEGGASEGLTLSWGAHSILCGIPIWLLGTEEQRQKYLTKLISAEWIGGFGLTEPNAGSDAASLKTTAVKKGDKYILNGSKMFITNGPIGNVFVVIAVTNKDAGHFGISAFIVESEFPGFSVGKELDKMGHRTSTTSELIFEDCEVPAENLIGQEGMGFVMVGKTTLVWGRTVLLAAGIGSIQHALDESVRYSQERHQFNRPICKFPAIQHKLADMKMLVEGSRMALYRAAWMKDQGIPAMLEASICKLFMSESGLKICDNAVQIHGGYGYMREYPVERHYRDTKLGTIGAGTSEVQRQIISKMILNPKKAKGGK